MTTTTSGWTATARTAASTHAEQVEGKKPDGEVKTFREAGKLLKAA